MGRDHRRKPADMGGPGKLIEVAGDAFQLRHIIDILAPHPLTDSPAPDKLTDDLGRTAARCAG